MSDVWRGRSCPRLHQGPKGHFSSENHVKGNSLNKIAGRSTDKIRGNLRKPRVAPELRKSTRGRSDAVEELRISSNWLDAPMTSVIRREAPLFDPKKVK